MLLSFLVVFAVLIVMGKGISLSAIIYLPIIMVVEYALALGMVFIFSALTIYLRDTEYILGIVSMAWQFLTPVMYSVDMVPESMRTIFYLNPMTSVIVAYRDILYYKKAPELQTLILAAVMGIVLLIVGILVFGKLERRFAENL
jgi:ABC-2 type transport system permease protein